MAVPKKKRIPNKPAAAHKVVAAVAPKAPKEMARLLHELEVQQIELEMQNKTLRAAQAELEASRSRYIELFEHAPVGYFDIDEKGLIADANLTAATLLNVPRNMLLGRPMAVFVLRDDADLYYLNIQKAFQANGPHTCELRMERKGSENFQAQLTVTAQDETTVSERILRFTVVDVTARTRAERELATTRELLDRTGALAKVGGWQVNLQTMKLIWTQETFRIAEIDSMVEPALEEGINLFAPEARPVIAAAVQAAIDKGIPYDLELPLITKKGKHIWVQTQGYAEMHKGKPIRIYGTFQDITARKQGRIDFASEAISREDK